MTQLGHVRATAAALICLVVLTGYATSIARMAVPEKLVDLATVTEFQDIRFWGDATPANLDRIVTTALQQRSQGAKPLLTARQRFLAISGGGSDGAFGAGLLAGWTEAGTRPEFDIVTGVSTGALIAPFAFLGPRYDAQLRELNTQHGTADLITSQILTRLLGGSALADSAPFEALLAKYVTADLLRAVAKEHLSGRRLLVGTTNIDAQRSVIWDMGAIAASGRDEALPLFRRILQASASIPGVFPPVRINVRAEGQNFDELHVDSGITAHVFFLPSQIMLKSIDQRYGLSSARELYVIRNGRIGPEYQVVEASLTSVAGRSLSTLTKTQANGELEALFFQVDT